MGMLTLIEFLYIVKALSALYSLLISMFLDLLTKECEYYHSPSYPVVCLGIGLIFIYLGGRFNFPAYFF
jgi:hypothetical protein